MSSWLVDTHALLWYLADDDRLSDDARRTMESADSILLISAASVWELAIKSSLGRLRLPDDFVAALEDEGFESLDVRFEHAWRAGELPLGSHKDPFDRLLAAQALLERLPVISNDEALDEYGVQRHW